LTDKKESIYKPGIYIPNNVLTTNIPPLAKILYGALQGFPSFEQEGVYASRKTLGAIIHCSSQRITELVKILVDSNFIFFNGQKKMKSGELIRLLKRVPPNEKSLDPPNEKSLDPPNEKSLGNKTSNNINIYSSKSPNGDNQRVTNTPSIKGSPKDDSRPSYWRNRNGINPSIVRFCEQIQKKMISNYPSKFKQYSPTQIDKKIEEGSKVIERLIRINGFHFENEIKPCLLWAIRDDFWSNQIRSLVPLRNKASNKEMKFTNIFDSWEFSKKKKNKQKGEIDEPQLTDEQWAERKKHFERKANKERLVCAIRKVSMTPDEMRQHDKDNPRRRLTEYAIKILHKYIEELKQEFDKEEIAEALIDKYRMIPKERLIEMVEKQYG
jgi:hypothetical protein